MTPNAANARPKRQLTLFDSTSIIVGIIIGAGIYEVTPIVAANVSSAGWLLAVWLLGGLISLIGALCYAELATAYPHEGGDYVYLTRAFGRSPGFLFAWAQMWIDAPGSIGAMAYVFARYANRLWPIPVGQQEYVALMIYAAAAVLVLSVVNMVGVRESKWTQNVLTVAKVLGLAAIVVVGLLFSADQLPTNMEGTAETVGGQEGNGFSGSFSLAIILVLFTYGGWKEMAYVAAEVRHPRKNIVRALMLGTVTVTTIYVLVNLASMHSLGLGGVRESDAVAADVLSLPFGEWGARFISLLICISALGAINGQLFASARVYYAMGTEHRLWRWLGYWSPRFGTPLAALVLQAFITLALVVIFGLVTQGGFQSMVEFISPIFWVFFLLVGFALFALRWQEPDRPRPYRVIFYPITPIIFCLSGLFMLYSTLEYALRFSSYQALWAIGILGIGMILCLFDRR